MFAICQNYFAPFPIWLLVSKHFSYLRPWDRFILPQHIHFQNTMTHGITLLYIMNTFILIWLIHPSQPFRSTKCKWQITIKVIKTYIPDRKTFTHPNKSRREIDWYMTVILLGNFTKWFLKCIDFWSVWCINHLICNTHGCTITTRFPTRYYVMHFGNVTRSPKCSIA